MFVIFWILLRFRWESSESLGSLIVSLSEFVVLLSFLRSTFEYFPAFHLPLLFRGDLESESKSDNLQQFTDLQALRFLRKVMFVIHTHPNYWKTLFILYFIKLFPSGMIDTLPIYNHVIFDIDTSFHYTKCLDFS